ncbi:protein phosphatase CheZ [Breoghania sp.]|uniref:protein phosphatase CheZ n=1 Tax=Breoghania sp. TaxID=2065378 RepID=UPI0029CA858F|nr:protein phosphatase CheZ [Breoghania sp.]
MAAASQTPALREEDYEAIESAVMETTRGRWFLSEYARRNRNADTEVLLSAIGQLEGLMKTERKGPKLERIQLDLADMAEAITRTKREIAQIKTESNDGDRFAEASSELDAIVTQTEGATQDILQKAELVQEIAWTLREQGVDEASCDAIDAHTTDIFMACSFQDLTGQRTQKVVQVLRYLESRINEMMEIWGVDANEMKVDVGPINPEDHRPDRDLLHGPQSTDKAIKQNTVDELMDSGVQYMSDDDDPMSAGEATSEAEATTDINEIEFDEITFDAIEVDTEEADAEEVSAEEAEAEMDATSDINVDEIVFDAIEQEVSESEESAAAEPHVSSEASSDASAAEDAAADMTVNEQSGEIDFDSISFDKIDSEDADVDEATAEDASAQEETPAAQEDTSEETSVSLADMEAPEGAQNVLEELLDASDDDETALDALAQEGDESAEEAIDAAADEVVNEAADQATDEGESSMDEAEEAEADADAAFLDMEQTADQEDEADESDPLRAMSAGERLALFN